MMGKEVELSHFDKPVWHLLVGNEENHDNTHIHCGAKASQFCVASLSAVVKYL
jgi:hypothetical protein